MAQRKSRYWLGSRGPFLFRPDREGEIPFRIQKAITPRKYGPEQDVALGSAETQLAAAEASNAQQTEHSNGAVANYRMAHFQAYQAPNYGVGNTANLRVP